MPRISAASNAAQRENTKRAILDSFGRLLYSRGLPGLTMTDIAKNAGVGRTAVYNYFADMGELLVAYAMDETDKFLKDLNASLEGFSNPIKKLAVYIQLEIERLSLHHMPPGPAMRSVLSPDSFAKLGKHVSELQVVLAKILGEAMDQGYIPQHDIGQLAQLVHGSLSASANRTDETGSALARQDHIAATIRFIQLGLGARFDSKGQPLTLDGSEDRVQLSAVS